ncbi:chorismate mutase [Paenibacillus jamilae]|uniref:chorismate mutase n=2 Tax=Paenibacillus TaxID=44249 RepID=E3E4U5_PAEPS|nr:MULTISPECIES: chorismate mutase [Paenibacillus]MCV9947982.1 chorismate mutase [Paenibacillus sp. BT-177]ADO57073.1 chorismate mutase [Paenibacillus polymyxa SC2]AJE53565.1 chorismate mutase [Paenibacillus polymyxa]AUO08398.1 chorismate mutase [Paenibacillus sp. lzh-N1]AZH29968.1 chorismate mutase [Paenibacillus sp. M-152]
MYNRGIRGATTVANNEANEILEATSQLLEEIVSYNEIQPDDISNVWITVTHDLDAAFPAMAIRQLDGWDMVPLMCALEIPVAGSLPKCIRLMVQVNTDKSQREMKHVYLNGAQMLRPDLASQGK